MDTHYNSPGRCRLDSSNHKVTTLGEYIKTMEIDYLHKKRHTGEVRILEGKERDEVLQKYGIKGDRMS